MLYKKWQGDTGVERLQLVVPSFLTSKILKEVHEGISHLGVHKTFDMLQKRFYWPGFHNAVENHCRTCEVCAKNKTVPRPRYHMNPIKIVPEPFHMVSADIIGPLKTTRQGNKYILTVIDYYTKYAEAEALPNQEAVTVVKALEQIFSRHGMPSTLFKRFRSNLSATASTRLTTAQLIYAFWRESPQKLALDRAVQFDFGNKSCCAECDF